MSMGSACLVEEWTAVEAMSAAESRDLQGDAHKLGYSSPHLLNILYIYAGGGDLSNHYDHWHLASLGLIKYTKEGKRELSPQGLALFAEMYGSYTGKVSVSAQERADSAQVERSLRGVRDPKATYSIR